MKVKELMSLLEDLPPDAEIKVDHNTSIMMIERNDGEPWTLITWKYWDRQVMKKKILSYFKWY